MTQELEKISSSQSSSLNLFDKEMFERVQVLSVMFANSELVPEMYRMSDKVPEKKATANCMIAISMAQRIGADILAVMQNLVIIYGRPTWSSKFLIGTVNTCGRFSPLQYEFKPLGKLGKVEYVTYDKKWVDGKNGGKGYYQTTPKTEVFDGTNIDNIECTAFTSARGNTTILRSSPVTVKMSIQEGWYTKSGSKWPNMTQQMLIYRTASFWTSAYAPELSLGMRTTEEVQDTIDIPYEEVKETLEKEIKDKANKETLTNKVEESKKEDKPAEKKKEPEKEPEGKSTGEVKMAPEEKPQTETEKEVPQNKPADSLKKEEKAPPSDIKDAPANRGLFNSDRGF
jgi:hypothetical protein